MATETDTLSNQPRADAGAPDYPLLAHCVFGLMVGVGVAIVCTIALPLLAGPLAWLLASMAGLIGWADMAQSLGTGKAVQDLPSYLSIPVAFGFIAAAGYLIFRDCCSHAPDMGDEDDDEIEDDESDDDGAFKESYWFVGIVLFGVLCLLGYFIQIFFFDLPRAFYEASLVMLRLAGAIFGSSTLESMARPPEDFARMMHQTIFWCAVYFPMRAAARRPGAATGDTDHPAPTSVAG